MDSVGSLLLDDIRHKTGSSWSVSHFMEAQNFHVELRRFPLILLVTRIYKMRSPQFCSCWFCYNIGMSTYGGPDNETKSYKIQDAETICGGCDTSTELPSLPFPALTVYQTYSDIIYKIEIYQIYIKYMIYVKYIQITMILSLEPRKQIEQILSTSGSMFSAPWGWYILPGWWLSHPSENMSSSVGILFPIYFWKYKKGPNHQPDEYLVT